MRYCFLSVIILPLE